MSYHEAQRRKLADGSNVVLIQLNPWSANPNDFATRVFHTPDEDEETKSGTEEIIVGDVLAVPECSLAPCVKEHLGLKEPKSPLNIRLRVYEHVLLLAQACYSTPSMIALNTNTATGVANDGRGGPEGEDARQQRWRTFTGRVLRTEFAPESHVHKAVRLKRLKTLYYHFAIGINYFFFPAQWAF